MTKIVMGLAGLLFAVGIAPPVKASCADEIAAVKARLARSPNSTNDRNQNGSAEVKIILAETALRKGDESKCMRHVRAASATVSGA